MVDGMSRDKRDGFTYVITRRTNVRGGTIRVIVGDFAYASSVNSSVRPTLVGSARYGTTDARRLAGGGTFVFLVETIRGQLTSFGKRSRDTKHRRATTRAVYVGHNYTVYVSTSIFKPPNE